MKHKIIILTNWKDFEESKISFFLIFAYNFQIKIWNVEENCRDGVSMTD